MGEAEIRRAKENDEMRIKASVGAAGGTEVEEEVEEIHISRGIGSILSTGKKRGKTGRHQQNLAKRLAAEKHAKSDNNNLTVHSAVAKAAKTELQGPISWASTDLRSKYRCETNRSSAYAAFLNASESAATMEREDGVIVSVPRVENHPIWEMYNKLVDLEVTRASNRARARNGMRRFVLDVHTVWITNLNALREHGIEKEEEGKTKGGRGLDGRRDRDRIIDVESQIQSVAATRTFRDAQEIVRKMEEEGEERKENFRKENRGEGERGSEDIPVKEPPRLPRPYVEPPEFWTLVRGEEISVSCTDQGSDKGEDYSQTDMRPHRIFVNRLRRREGDVGTPLWAVNLYDVENGNSMARVLEEVDVLKIVEKARGKEAQGTNQQLQQQPMMVHRQAIRLPCGDSMIPALASVFVRRSGPHIRCLIRLHLKGKTAMVDVTDETFQPPKIFELETTTYEVVARLGKQGVISALNYDFWAAGNNENGGIIWRELISKLFYEMWEPPKPPEIDPDLAGGGHVEEEKKEDTVSKKKKKKKKKKNKKDRDDTEEDLSATASSFPKFTGTIPHRVTFLPTPHHDESDQTIRIGGLTDHGDEQDDDGHDELSERRREGRSLLQGMNDYFTCVSIAYELTNVVSVLDNKVIVGNRNSSKAVELTEREEGGKNWTKEFDKTPSLSMRSSGRIGFHQLCPGTIPIGKNGLWFKHSRREGDTSKRNEDQENSVERTRAIACYLRDPNLSSSLSVLVNCLLALESPLVAPLTVAWEPLSATPPPAPHMETECIVPMFMSDATSLLANPVDSQYDHRNAPTILCLTSAEKEQDFSKKAEHGQKEKHRRRTVTADANFFRCKTMTLLLNPDHVIPKFVFGVTKKGASCNTTGVNGRNMWHSEQRCVEQLCRVRGPVDYIGVMRNEYTDVHGGQHNMANVYVIKLYGYKLNELEKGGEKAFHEAYEKVKEAREAKMKAEALSAKIEAGKLLLEKKQAAEELMIRQEGLKKLEASGRGGGKGKGEGLTSRAWQKRVKRSVILSFQQVGTQGWEQRLDPKYNQIFYHNTDPYVTAQLGNQWDPPADWDENIDEILRPGSVSSKGGSRGGIISRAMSRQQSRQQSGGGGRGGKGDEDGNANANTPDNLAMTPGGGFRSTRDLNGLALLDDDVESTGSEVERLIDNLTSNDDFVKAIAYKLGVPEEQIRGIDREVPLNPREDETSRSEHFRSSVGDPRVNAVSLAGETELAEDDDGWSDSDDEVGGVGELMEGARDGLFPQDHVDNRSEFVRERNEQAAIDTEFVKVEEEWKAVEDGGVKKVAVPALPIEGKINSVAPIESLEAHVGVRGYGWRRLGKEKVPDKNFFKMGEHKIQKCTGEGYNKVNKPTMVGMLDPKEVLSFENDESQFNTIKVESLFVKNVLDDVDRVIKMTEVRMKREKMLLDENVNSLKDIIDIQPSEFTSVDHILADDNGGGNEEDIAANNAHKAILSVKNSNFDALETVLDEGIQIDTRDEYGNTLLILACQQGNKRMAKFLLRRGANINAQNNTGNTLLHYLHEYKNLSLAEYMKNKGCDDSFVNADGCTCYEGLKKDQVDMI